MTHLTKEELAQLREKLEQERALVSEELSRIGRKNPTNPADWEPKPETMDIQEADRNEAADRIEAYEENTAVLKQLETQFNLIEEALVRMDNNTYGMCNTCNKPIPKERLFANPSASTCLTHANGSAS